MVSVLSDNARNMIELGKILNKKHPHIIPVSCLALELDSQLSQILKIPSINCLIETSRNVINEIRSSSKKYSLYESAIEKFSKETNIEHSKLRLSSPLR